MVSEIFNREFIWRRSHSLLGIWLVLFLTFHLITNSQAALWIGDDGIGFIKIVTLIHSLPYLKAIEWGLLGFPILLHAVWGLKILKTSNSNVLNSEGKKPYLPFERNKAYTLQRWTSWILLVGILAHILHMSILNRPEKIHLDNQKGYLVHLSNDEGLLSVSKRLSTDLLPVEATYGENYKDELGLAPQIRTKKIDALAPDFATAMLLVVRNAFKNIMMCVVYSFFVCAAVFHASNGFWSFLIRWGVIGNGAAQRRFLLMSKIFMALLAFLGLISIWGSYWVNLRH